MIHLLQDIKNVSWGDIPSHQKKVSERFRELNVERAFTDIREITSEIEKGGGKGNRGDMGMVREVFGGYGLEDTLDKVLMG